MAHEDANDSSDGAAPALRGGASSDGAAPALRGGASSDGAAPALRGGASSDGAAPALRGGASSDGAAPALRGGASLHEEAWSALALSLAPVPPGQAARDRLLSSLRGSERFMPFVADVVRVFGLTPAATREALVLAQDKSAWRAGFFPGSFMLTTPALSAAHVLISRLPAGVRIPQHRHTGREATFVLDGLLVEDGQREHRAGAVLDMQAGTQHALEVAGGEDCLVVFLLAPV